MFSVVPHDTSFSLLEILVSLEIFITPNLHFQSSTSLLNCVSPDSSMQGQAPACGHHLGAFTSRILVTQGTIWTREASLAVKDGKTIQGAISVTGDRAENPWYWVAIVQIQTHLDPCYRQHRVSMWFCTLFIQKTKYPRQPENINAWPCPLLFYLHVYIGQELRTWYFRIQAETAFIDKLFWYQISQTSPETRWWDITSITTRLSPNSISFLLRGTIHNLTDNVLEYLLR